MPLYDFRCHGCNTEFEVLQKAGDPNPPCEACGQRTERLIGLTSVVTDSTFMAGIGTLDSQIGSAWTGQMEGMAGRFGYRPTGSEYYCPALARFPYDPEAFITSRKEAKDILKKRNWDAEGAVTNHKVTCHKQKPPPRLNKRIVDRFEAEYIAERPELANKDRAELRHEIIERHGSPPD